MTCSSTRVENDGQGKEDIANNNIFLKSTEDVREILSFHFIALHCILKLIDRNSTLLSLFINAVHCPSCGL